MTAKKKFYFDKRDALNLLTCFVKTRKDRRPYSLKLTGDSSQKKIAMEYIPV